MPDLRLDLLDQHVAEAIAAARIADIAIGTDVIPNLSHLKRCHPTDVRKLLIPDRLFEERTLTDIDALVETVERAILIGTTEETICDELPENVSGDGWVRKERDSQAKDLYLALPVLHDLRERLQAIRDLLAARRLLERLNADLQEESGAGTPPSGHADDILLLHPCRRARNPTAVVHPARGE